MWQNDGKTQPPDLNSTEHAQKKAATEVGYSKDLPQHLKEED